jgi:hypothetical protein
VRTFFCSVRIFEESLNNVDLLIAPKKKKFSCVRRLNKHCDGHKSVVNMIESINKNTEVVGVSDALKQLATKKSTSPGNASINSVNPPLQKQLQIDDGTIMDNKITINPSSSIDDSIMGQQRSDCENGKAVSELDATTQSCGWWKFKPKCLQQFMNPRYALAFLCLAGAIQGN